MGNGHKELPVLTYRIVPSLEVRRDRVSTAVPSAGGSVIDWRTSERCAEMSSFLMTMSKDEDSPPRKNWLGCTAV